MKNKIAVLLAVYNGELFLKESVQSVINQTYTNFELLIGFNGTVDKSRDIVSQFNDNRIRVFDYGPDKGKAKTLNKLIREANADWCAIHDDDDVWQINKLEKQVYLCDDFDIIGTQIQYIDENGKHTGYPSLSSCHKSILSKSLDGDNQIANTSAIFKKSKALEVGGWDETLDGIEDFDFWLKMIMFAKCKVVNLPERLVLHRLHNKSNFNTKTFDVEKLTKKYKLCS